MSKRELYRKAITLRLKGMSYGEIREKVPVSKSTLSRWLDGYELNEDQLFRFKIKRQKQVEKFRVSMRKKIDFRLNTYLLEEKKRLFPLSEKEFFLLGLGLYWGEGQKANRSTVSINNTDPSVVLFALNWYINSLKIPIEKIHVSLHLYSDMDIKKEIEFWAKYLHISIDNFNNPYIKKTNRIALDHKGFGHGTCGIYVGNTLIKEHILMALKAISEEKVFTLV